MMKLKNSYVSETRDKILSLVGSQENWRSRCINLIASENVMSPLARRAYNSDFMHRYAEGEPYKRYYNGTKYIDELEVLVSKIFSEMLGTEYVDVRPISGTVANLAVFSSLASPGDILVSLSTPDGGHISHNKYGAPTALGLKVVNYEFDKENMNIDVDGTRKKLEELEREGKTPRIFVLGASLFLFPHPVKEIKELALEYSANLVYDSAHVLGLILSGNFQDPVAEGADIVTGSTHKTLPGPQGGMIATNSQELFESLKKGVFPRTTSNHHLHRIPALGITLLEMIEFGRDYGDQTIKNAKALAEEMYSLGLPVIAEHIGFTESHQIALDMSKIGLSGKEAADLAERANIILNKNLLPGEPLKNVKNPNGIRIGVQEMTRFGMKEEEMKQIAEFLYRIWVKKEGPERVKEDVVNFRDQFRKEKYCRVVE